MWKALSPSPFRPIIDDIRGNNTRSHGPRAIGCGGDFLQDFQNKRSSYLSMWYQESNFGATGWKRAFPRSCWMSTSGCRDHGINNHGLEILEHKKDPFLDPTGQLKLIINIALLATFVYLWNPHAFPSSQRTYTSGTRGFGISAMVQSPWSMKILHRSSRARAESFGV